MTKQKDLKRLIRARMDKTGEAYTAARAHIVAKRSPPAAEYASLAGVKDASVQAKTGRTWAEWVEALDAIEAITMSHREIAKYVKENNEISGWWAQSVTVGYERIRGLREIGQQREGPKAGLYEISKSKTFPVPVSVLYTAFNSKTQRLRWLPLPELKIRTARTDKSIGFDWADGTRVSVTFTAKSGVKSSVQVAHVRLPNAEVGPALREYWAERLAALTAVLQP